jgi:hypothetical protein
MYQTKCTKLRKSECDSLPSCKPQIVYLTSTHIRLQNKFFYLVKVQYRPTTNLSKYLLSAYSMEQSPSWEASRFSASQAISWILWKPKFHYRLDKCSPLIPLLNQINPVHDPTSCLLRIHLNIILPSTPPFPKWSLSLTIPHQNPVCTSSLPHTCYMSRPFHYSWFDHPNTI